ncbi:MAG: CpaF family protein [Planctomycetota bacterium]
MDVLGRIGSLKRNGAEGKKNNVEPERLKKSSAQVAEKLKRSLHQRVVDVLDLTKISFMKDEEFQREVRKGLQSIINTEPGSELLNASEKKVLIDKICDEMLGLGPLEHLLLDDTITDILVNGTKQVFIERNGKLELTDVSFHDEAHLMHIIERIVSAVGRRIDESTPMVDARLPDGSRVHAIIPPLAIDGPALSIRRFGTDPFSEKDLLEKKSISKEIVGFLQTAVKGKMNILISGGTGSGKTTLLNILSGYIPNDERIVTIEDSAELQLKQEHVVRLETRAANVEGRGEVAQRELLRNTLRMRPNRIIVGEVRGAEALDMLQAMNTGHEGSLSTIHANTTRDALTRLEVMCLMTGLEMPVQSIRYYISSALDLVIQIARLSDGGRKLMSISEVTGMEGQMITTSELFKFTVSPKATANGKTQGEFGSTGIRPRCYERIEAMGISIPGS